ncbi:MAG: hypothetical protein U1E14_14645 [Geminicoccaceae bacterium]
MTAIRVRTLDAAEAHARAADLTAILEDCVEGNASVSFMAPLARATALAFWRKVADGVAAGGRILLVAEDGRGRWLGTVQLVLDLPENQPHRADLAKMLVLRSARRQGVRLKRRSYNFVFDRFFVRSFFLTLIMWDAESNLIL